MTKQEEQHKGKTEDSKEQEEQPKGQTEDAKKSSAPSATQKHKSNNPECAPSEGLSLLGDFKGKGIGWDMFLAL